MLSQDNDQPHSESMLLLLLLRRVCKLELTNNLITYAGSILSQLLNAVNEMGAKYSFLYISDPFRSDEYVSHKGLERFLAEGTMGNASANSTGCDEVCQIKSSLLEGLLVVSTK